DMRTDVCWYAPRLHGGWQWVAIAVVLLGFALPFGLLLLRRVKQSRKALGATAGLILFMHLVFMNWQVLPSFRAPDLAQHWMDLLMPVGLGCMWWATFVRQLAAHPKVVAHDDNRAEAEHLQASDVEERAWEESLAHG
ncbi:MAG TPA: hypothetical protein VG713_09150, partial [Pirellulales bacterium]|nr:hypothetical protein [Pirellulales bacterium]